MFIRVQLFPVNGGLSSSQRPPKSMYRLKILVERTPKFSFHFWITCLVDEFREKVENSSCFMLKSLFQWFSRTDMGLFLHNSFTLSVCLFVYVFIFTHINFSFINILCLISPSFLLCVTPLLACFFVVRFWSGTNYTEEGFVDTSSFRTLSSSYPLNPSKGAG